jgi:N-acetylmuramoyl-L-alanine amidase
VNFKIIPPERVQYLVVHCSATPPSMDIGATEIDRMHRMRGFFKIGYHFVIRRNGEVETGREVFASGSAEPGAHFAGLNLVSLGICLIGGVEEQKTDGAHEPEANFTPEQYATLQALLSELSERYPTARVIGHGDRITPPEVEGSRPVAAKACPSFDVRQWLKAGCPKTGVPTRR